ncbi:conserved exported hypothetical protein [Planktothrix serta PCC 8927]|uniref:FecR protein domain-containing protein n=1 Tax=Planktothrix serta PCC 8927 TaxID=671068 RepID=A0A7Z9BNT3_9CYAN|nr:hypothetical protein [Planktothrix serta]VXD18972.1 conserved exported hypothetical protein [Planktothrix serta PCC 8927]
MLTFSLFSGFSGWFQSPRYWRRILTGLIIGFCLVFSTGLFQQSTVAQINLAIIQEILDGDQVFIQDNQAKVEDQAEFGQIVLTKKSRAGVIFNNGAAGRMDANSVVTVGQCVEIKQGQILVSGPINGCIAGFTVGVQGTIYILETTDNNTGNVKVLEGTVQVSSSDGTGEPVEVKEGEKVSVLQGILSQVIPMTPEEIVSILSGRLFSGFTIPVTPEGALYSLCSRLLPGFSCSTSGIPTPSIPTPPVPVPIPRLPF